MLSGLILAAISTLAAAQNNGRQLSDLEYITEQIKTISSDEFGGRKPLSEYETKTIEYISSEYRRLGLQAAFGDSYYQDVEQLKTRTSVKGGKVSVRPSRGKRIGISSPQEIILWTNADTDIVELKNAPVVFAGYGISAPEYDWDDYKGADVSGKVVLVLENDPGRNEESIFSGKGLTYYGRASYKYEEAFRRGAAACLVIHQSESSAYTYSALQAAHGGQEISLLKEDKNGVCGWIACDAAKQIIKAAGTSIEELCARASGRDFRLVDLKAGLSVSLEVETQKGVSHNVIGVIPGTDLKDECVVVVAHWDHLGIGKEVDGDGIYNGAGDNASGVAGMLAHIRSFLSQGTPLRRSVVFAALTGEEDGLLGSEWYCAHPVFPIAKTAAAVNIDGGAPLGKARNVEVYAGGLSNVDEMVSTLAAAQGRRADIISPDTRGIFFRTDLFNFLKVGIPGAFICGGQDWIDPEDHRNHFKPPYHHPKDEWRDDWDMSGVMDQWNLIHALIELYANSDSMPRWNEDSPYQRPAEQSVNAERSRREKVLSVLDQSHPNEYVPAAFFMHFHNKLGKEAVRDHIDFFRKTNMDIVKVQYEVVAPKVSIRSKEDFEAIPRLGEEFFEPQIEVIRALSEELRDEALIIPTVYCPLSLFRQMTGKANYIRLIEQYPEQASEALGKITESIKLYMELCSEAGADGFYISTQGREAEILGRNGLFDSIVRKYDRELSCKASELGIFNILHICDWEGKYDDIDSFTDYPASVINPPLTLIDGSEIDLKRISELYKRPVMGGMNRLGNLAKGSVEECLEEVDRVMEKAPANFILGADCTVPDADVEKLRQVIDYVHNWRKRQVDAYGACLQAQK